ncbi:uncharacterized protein K02A2.6-like [Dermacentor silvarum]|uniref:uncharacterized protein K02A2.6-like n=1 Tax=Dermacentor silvarum TaxID=543639 RepID=UPI002100E4D5|nr:uncharacterized protein K02A2.6-like [Dermacentor silvarum]
MVLENSDLKLRGYFGHQSAVVGKATVLAKFGGKHARLPLFVVKSGTRALLGRNWAKAFGMPLDSLLNVHSVDDVKDLISRFPDVFSEGLGNFAGVKAKIRVPEDVKPRFFRPRPVPFALQDMVAQELQRLQREGILRPVRTAEWAAPLVPVLKKDGKIRLCGDFKVTVNRAADIETYPVPRVEEIWAQLAGGVMFSKLDLRDAYQQVELDEESKKLVTNNTRQGIFQYSRLPFGVASAPAIFQREMECMLRGCHRTVVYFDDILVSGVSEEDHRNNLEEVLRRLSGARLRLNLQKCVFETTSVEYLEYVIDKHGLHPAPEKIEAIVRAPAPSDTRELQSYLGLLNFYRRFLPNLSTVLHPLHVLLKKDTSWHWVARQEAAFTQSKQLLTSAEVLIYYDTKLPLLLCCDASPYGIGAVLAHRMPSGEEKPVAFASRRLTAAENNYSQLDKEALAVVFGVLKFHQFVWGRPFDIFTDHKPLLGLFGHESRIPLQSSPRVLRWALTLSGYNYKLCYRPGARLGNADALSRLPLARAPLEDSRIQDVFMLEGAYPGVLSAAVVESATDQDPVLAPLRVALWSGEHLPPGQEWRPFANQMEEFSVMEGCVLRGSRVVVPVSLRAAVLDLLHESHPGVEKMKLVARSHVWWPGIDEDIAMKVGRCKVCQVYRNAPKPIQQAPRPFPERAWSRLDVDFGGPFQGVYFLVLVDAFSKWVEVVRVASPSAESTIACLRNIFACHGLPDIIVSDNGPAFTSATYKSFLARNAVRPILIPPCHPASNGAAERVVQTVKDKLKKTQPGNFECRVARILLAYRSTPHALTGRSPAELLMGRLLKTALDLLKPDLRSKVQFRQLQQKVRSDSAARREPVPLVGDTVWARNFRPGPRWVPAVVGGATSSSSTEVQLADGTVWNRHADHLRRRLEGTEESPTSGRGSDNGQQIQVPILQPFLDEREATTPARAATLGGLL